MRKGQRSGKCSGCQQPLVEENSSSSVREHGSGFCRLCDVTRKTKWRRNNPEVYKEQENNYRINNREDCCDKVKRYQRTTKGRHVYLRREVLTRENISQTDMLWSFNFYASLLLDNECHYCLGKLNGTGSGIDRVENSLGHVCYNVVPCCKLCNRIKGNDVSYQEMMVLSPALRQIRKSRVSLATSMI